MKDALVEAMERAITRFYGSNPLTNDDFPTIVNDKRFHRLVGLLEGHDVAVGGRSDQTSRRLATCTPTFVR